MKNTIKIGKTIYKMLSGSTAVTAEVGNKIYPLIAPDTTTFPFIVFSRSGIDTQYCKDCVYEDRATITVIVVAEDYETAVDTANAVRQAIENKRYNDTENQIEIKGAYLQGVTEYYQNDTHVQTLNFTVTVA